MTKLFDQYNQPLVKFTRSGDILQTAH